MTTKHILIVEDNPDNRKLTEWLLDDQGYSYDSVETAEAALTKVQTVAYDLILMDISLPGMSGKDATIELRKQEQFATLPIIALTAHAVSGERESIFASGVNDIVTKPIDENELLAAIHKYLNAE